eukprot:308482_1
MGKRKKKKNKWLQNKRCSIPNKKTPRRQPTWRPCQSNSRDCLQLITRDCLQQKQQPFDEMDSLQLLNEFLHLLDKHNDDEQFEYISSKLQHCDINSCKAFRRNHRNRDIQHEEKNNELNIEDSIKLEIIDKIHSFYCHSYDTGNRLKISENININTDANKVKQQNESWKQYMTNKGVTKVYKSLRKKRKCHGDAKNILNGRKNKYNNLGQDSTKNTNEKNNKYNYGYLFDYGDDTEIKQRFLHKTKVFAKYSNLKQEVTQNKFHVIVMEQFKHELKKAKVHKHSQYCKSKFEPSFTVDHILSLMLYCNYDTLQYVFSKTYRMNEGRDHNEFYFWAKFLKQSVKQYGMRMCQGNTKTLYHGISEQLLIKLFIPNMECPRIGCPLSTTSSLSVAINFTNYNEGLVLQFSDGSTPIHLYTRWLEQQIPNMFGYDRSPIYFSVAWLSDFANESEYLFIQNGFRLLIMDNIINSKTGMEYKYLIHALYRRNWRMIVDKAEIKESTYYSNTLNHKLVEQLMDEIIICELNQSEFDFITDEYATKLINTYLKNDNKEMFFGIPIELEGSISIKLFIYLFFVDYWIKNNICNIWKFGTMCRLLNSLLYWSVIMIETSTMHMSWTFLAFCYFGTAWSCALMGHWWKTISLVLHFMAHWYYWSNHNPFLYKVLHVSTVLYPTLEISKTKNRLVFCILFIMCLNVFKCRRLNAVIFVLRVFADTFLN